MDKKKQDAYRHTDFFKEQRARWKHHAGRLRTLWKEHPEKNWKNKIDVLEEALDKLEVSLKEDEKKNDGEKGEVETSSISSETSEIVKRGEKYEKGKRKKQKGFNFSPTSKKA